MVCMNTEARVPSSADARLDELAEILARGMLRIGTKKSRFESGHGLELSAETRLSVTASDVPELVENREVT